MKERDNAGNNLRFKTAVLSCLSSFVCREQCSSARLQNTI